MTRPIAKHISGEQVRLALITARPDGLAKRELVEITGLTASQVGSGVMWIKETAAAEHLTPLTWTIRDGYRFSEDPMDWVSYDMGQFRRILTKLSRLITGTIDPHKSILPHDPFPEMLLTNTEAMLGNLKFVLKQRYDSPPSPPSPARSARSRARTGASPAAATSAGDGRRRH